MIRSGLISGGVASGLVPLFGRIEAAETPLAALKLRWTRDEKSRLFTNVQCDGAPLALDEPGLLDGFCRLMNEASEKPATLGAGVPTAKHGPLQIELRHQLLRSGGASGEDVLEATLTVRNTSNGPQAVELGFATSAQPLGQMAEQHVYIPLNAAGPAGDPRFAPLGVKQFIKDCRYKVGEGELKCHYLEPLASYPDGERETRALLLAPVVDLYDPQAAARVALFTASDEAMRFSTAAGKREWRAGRCLTIPAGGTITQRCWLMVHAGDAAVAWKAFHQFAHFEKMPQIGWVRDFKVHYYDFLSAVDGKNGHRGGGYDAAVPFFREFHVGMATQHGYYPCMGDHIHPDRKNWLAMQTGKGGPAAMSIDIIKERIKATRATGAKAAIYMHQTALDDSSKEFYPSLAVARQVGADGLPVRVPWKGPDVKGGLWWMSMAAPEWRNHLLQQAQWIMEILKPDAIVMDETFSGLGYDQTPGREGPLGPHSVDFFKKFHALVRSFGEDKAFFTSDCSMAGFVMWADGEAGDHTYPGLSGNPLYTQEPLRFLAALGDRPWRPCAWHFQGMWETQMKLARQVGAGVGLSNGWVEFTGLHKLPPEVKSRMIADIESIL